MMKLFLPLPFLILPATFASAGDGVPSGQHGSIELAQMVTGTAKQKLQKLLRPHVFFGDRITDDIKAATGDPNIIVIDRRWQWGEIYSCNYQYLRGKHQAKALVCE